MKGKLNYLLMKMKLKQVIISITQNQVCDRLRFRPGHIPDLQTRFPRCIQWPGKNHCIQSRGKCAWWEFHRYSDHRQSYRLHFYSQSYTRTGCEVKLGENRSSTNDKQYWVQLHCLTVWCNHNMSCWNLLKKKKYTNPFNVHQRRCILIWDFANII